jgi:hypothetical protein
MRCTLPFVPTTLVCLALVSIASADCTPPKNAGAVICFPSKNATVTLPIIVEAAATGENGLPITKMILYSNNHKMFEQDNSNTLTFEDVSDGYNQTYNLVVNAWDSEGHLFQYSDDVKVTGGAYTCSHPTSGINLCGPPDGSWQPDNGLEFLAYASSDVTSMNTWENGSLVQTASGNVALVDLGNPTPGPEWESFTVKAYKGSTAAYTATTDFKVYYAYQGTDGINCYGASCPPGLWIQQPGDNAQDVNSPFAVQAQVVQNSAPVTSMKVYVDNSVVATSTGATIVASVPASSGTHILTVQAWDTTGMLYKSQWTVNVY